MTLRLGNITFDCAEPRRVADFWSLALGEPVDEFETEFFCSIGIGRREVSPKWLFLRVPEAKASKNRMHVDLTSRERAEDVARLVAAGANHVGDVEEHGLAWSVLTDVEGNEFCITEHGGPSPSDV